MEKCKKIIVLPLLLVSVFNGYAQGIFSQKAGQIKNLIKQVALLQVYIGYVENGYAIAREGLTAIGGIKQGDFNLHLDYFDKLKAVNPSIKRYTGMAEITALQLAIVRQNQKTLQYLASNPLFAAGELSYVQKVFSGLLEQCSAVLDELIDLTTPGIYALKDNERMARIGILKADMQDKYAFAQKFGQDVQLLALQKARELQEVRTGRLLNNIK